MGRSPYQHARYKVIIETLEKYPETSTRSLARILYRDYPEFFSNYENARSAIRVYRGSNGEYLRKVIRMKKYFKNEIQST